MPKCSTVLNIEGSSAHVSSQLQDGPRPLHEDEDEASCQGGQAEDDHPEVAQGAQSINS